MNKFKLYILVLLITLSSCVNSDNTYLKNTSTDIPPGKLYNINKAKLHLYCIGKGETTIIFESGLGGNMLEWSRIHPKVANITRACVYDRAGYGWSTRGLKPRLVSVIANELKALLDLANEKEPYIFVGHSFGGLIAQKFMQNYGKTLAGVLLIDSMHAKQFEEFEKADLDIIPLKPTRDIVFSSKKILTYGIPAYLKEVAYQLASTDKTRSFLFNEMRNLEKSNTEINNKFKFDVPLIILSQGNKEWKNYSKHGHKIDKIWKNLQKNLKNKSSVSKSIVLTNSGHQIHLDKPNVVINSINALLEFHKGNKNVLYDLNFIHF